MLYVVAAAKLLQSCPTLCDPVDSSPPGFPVPGILQARTLVGCHFLLHCMKVKSESEIAQLCPTLATPWTAAYQAPPSMRLSRQKYWSRVPLLSLSRYSNLLRKGRGTRDQIACQHPLDHRKTKRVPEKHLLLLH